MTNISSWTDLKAMSDDLSEDYVLTTDLSTTDSDYSSAGGDDWTPIGNLSNFFTGSFDGGNHTISGLTIATLGTALGLFGVVTGGTIKDLILKDATIDVSDVGVGGGIYGGILAGYANCDITNVHVTGTSSITLNVAATSIFGGLLGQYSTKTTYGPNTTVTLTNSSADVDIHVEDATGTVYCGGMAGRFLALNTTATTINITKCYAKGDILIEDVNGASYTVYAGGFTSYLQPYAAGGTINVSQCYATGNITVQNSITRGLGLGGFSGNAYSYQYGGTSSILDIVNCYSSGDVTVDNITPNYVCAYGGFIGFNQLWQRTGTATFNMEYCYATGNVITKNMPPMPVQGVRRGGFLGHIRDYVGTMTMNDCWCSGDCDYDTVGTIRQTGKFIGYAERFQTFTDCGVWTGSEPSYDIERPEANLTASQGSANRTADKTDFYDITFGDLYDNWDIVKKANHDGVESTAIWYIDDTVDYPHLWYEYMKINSMGVSKMNGVLVSMLNGVA